jgi:anti-anti-sigma regulatory factor
VILLGSNDLVKATLESTGIDEVIPLFEEDEQAERAVLS